MIKNFIRRLFGKPKNPMDFQASLRLCSLPVVTFQQGDAFYNFMLDTGSSDSIIDQAVLKEIEHKILPIEGELYGMDGIKRAVRHCELTLSYKNESYTYVFQVTDMSPAFNQIKQDTGVTIHGILGNKFFNAFRYILDFDELIAYSKKS